jgi:hypothetical protein
MSDDQVGKYIRLLCLQHQKGGLTEEDMKKICNSYDGDVWSKFEQNGDGKYYNARMREETDKRARYSKSRSDNRLGKNKEENSKHHMKNISKTYVKHMENENENINKGYTNQKETFENLRDQLFNMAESQKMQIALSIKDAYPKAGIPFINAMIGRFTEYLLAKDDIYEPVKHYRMYFVNWLKNEIKKDKDKIDKIYQEAIRYERANKT